MTKGLMKIKLRIMSPLKIHCYQHEVWRYVGGLQRNSQL